MHTLEPTDEELRLLYAALHAYLGRGFESHPAASGPRGLSP
jgi:hypothetical protein